MSKTRGYEQVGTVRWGSASDAVWLSGLSRGMIFNLAADGLIRTRIIIRENAPSRGRRLFDLNSLRAFIENAPTTAPEEIQRKYYRAMRRAVLARNAARLASDRRVAQEARTTRAREAAAARWARARESKGAGE